MRVEYRDQAVALHLQRGAGAIAAACGPDRTGRSQFRIVEDQAVRVDEFADFARQRAVQFFAQLLEFLARVRERVAQVHDFRFDLAFG